MKSNRWEQLRRCNQHLRKHAFSTYVRLLEVLCSSTQGEAALTLSQKIRDKDWTGLVLEADRIASVEYSSLHEHRVSNQLASLIRKYPWPKGSVVFDPEAKALETFQKADRKCGRLNRKFKLFDTLRSPHEQALHSARSWIAYVLGDFNLAAAQSECDFGPGASVGIHGSATNPARKLLSKGWSVTPGASIYAYRAMFEDTHIVELLNRNEANAFYAHDPAEFRSRFASKVAIVDYNKITFVPKSAKTDRSIAIEPLLNGYLQKGVDLLMRKRLRRVGIDLSDQTRNQELAREGSLKGVVDPYVTIDLSSASDSVSIGLCRNLLPPEWFEYLSAIRSPSYELRGEVIRYNKFASMGNGFCFPLETLIFASVCHAAYVESSRKPDFSVYGDDIIVRQSVATRVLDLLRMCGFAPNTGKTFLKGPFRESCGADWFEGEDVRPLNLDFAFDSLESLFKFINQGRSKEWWNTILAEGLDFLETLIPSNLRLVRPYPGNTDSALEVPFDVFLASPFSRWDRDTQCWSWLELKHTAMPDKGVAGLWGFNTVLMRGALTGSLSSLPFAERRKVRTKFVRVKSSAQSNSTHDPFDERKNYLWCAFGGRYKTPSCA